MNDEQYRLRAQRKRLQVKFPDGRTICYASATDTVVETLKEIGAERFPEITLEMSKMRIVSQEAYPRFKNYMKPICDGWYFNSQSNNDTKYLQLRAISEALQLGLEIQLESGLEVTDKLDKEKSSKSKQKLKVCFPDGVCITGSSSAETFIESLRKIGIAEIARRDIEMSGRLFITAHKENNRQVNVDDRYWINMPVSTKERAKQLRIIALQMRINLEITVL